MSMRGAGGSTGTGQSDLLLSCQERFGDGASFRVSCRHVADELETNPLIHPGGGRLHPLVEAAGVDLGPDVLFCGGGQEG